LLFRERESERLAPKAGDSRWDDRLGLEAESDVRALGVSRIRAWTLSTLAMLALSVTLVDRQALAALAVGVTSSLGISETAYGWLSSGFAGAYLLGSLPAARLIQRIGPRLGLAASVAASSIVIALHGVAHGFFALLSLRIALGLAVAPAFACAAQTIHFVLPFKDRARGIGMLYMGNSLGSALCPPIAVALGSAFGWRAAFACVAAIGMAWIPLWLTTALAREARMTLDSLRPPPPTASGVRLVAAPTLSDVLRNPASLRATLLVAASAPVTTIMLIWGAKYLARDHGIAQSDVGHYLWLPALLFGSSSLLFGELRARSARTRAKTRPPRRLVLVATLLASCIAAVPLFRDARACVLMASVAMMGAGGLYTLATSDLLAHTRAGTTPIATGLTTLTQSLVYVAISPVIGYAVERSGHYDAAMIGAALWLLPGSAFWLVHATTNGGGPRERTAAARHDEVSTTGSSERTATPSCPTPGRSE
jgi:MFS transporter, ACS family, D-galactonate transporter